MVTIRCGEVSLEGIRTKYHQIFKYKHKTTFVATRSRPKLSEAFRTGNLEKKLGLGPALVWNCLGLI